MKIEITDVQPEDEVFVDGQQIDAQGPDVPPEEPEEPAEPNHFGDWLDQDWGYSLTLRDDMTRYMFNNRPLTRSPGAIDKVKIPGGEDTTGRRMHMANSGFNTSARVKVFAPNGSVLVDEVLAAGSGVRVTDNIGEYAGQTLKVKWPDGCDLEMLQIDFA